MSAHPGQASISWRYYRDLLSTYLKPYWLRATLLGLAILAGTAIQLLTPQIVRRFVDAVQAGQDSAALLRVGTLFLAAALVRRTVAVAATYLTQDLKWLATNRLRSDLARHCLRLGMGFHDGRTPGEMIERIDGDVMALSNFFSAFLLQLVANGLLLLGVLAALTVENRLLGLAFGIYVLITFFLFRRTAPLAVPYWQTERAASADLYGFLEERLAGTEDIRASGAEAHTLQGYYTSMRQQFLASRRASMMSMLPWAAASSMFAINEGVSLLLGVRLFQANAISLGTVYLVLEYCVSVSQPLEMFARQVQDLQGATASILRIRELQAYVPEGAPTGAAAVLHPQVAGGSNGKSGMAEVALTQTLAGLSSGALGVRLAHVNFGYAADTAVLRDVSFALQPGEVLGLLGRTGSGKTTIARLLLRLYEPDSGTISLGRGAAWADARTLALPALRGRIGMVTQNVQLFSASLRDNLTLFGALPASDERILATLSELGLDAWSRGLPAGLDTMLEANGAGLSAGQAQLLVMARLFLQDPSIVVLDEATSRLDPATERLVDRAMERLIAGRTAIIIAHRLSTVQRADQVVILEDGRVLEAGLRVWLAADPDSRFAGLLRTGLAEVLS